MTQEEKIELLNTVCDAMSALNRIPLDSAYRPEVISDQLCDACLGVYGGLSMLAEQLKVEIGANL